MILADLILKLVRNSFDYYIYYVFFMETFLFEVSNFDKILIQHYCFDLILYVPSIIFQLNRDGSSWVGLVRS